MLSKENLILDIEELLRNLAESEKALEYNKNIGSPKSLKYAAELAEEIIQFKVELLDMILQLEPWKEKWETIKETTF